MALFVSEWQDTQPAVILCERILMASAKRASISPLSPRSTLPLDELSPSSGRIRASTSGEVT
jgi:hypothetical protein